MDSSSPHLPQNEPPPSTPSIPSSVVFQILSSNLEAWVLIYSWWSNTFPALIYTIYMYIPLMTKPEILLQLDIYYKAIQTFHTGLKGYKKADLIVRDGCIQRFEYCIELTWKTLKKILEYQGLEIIPTPIEVIKKAAQV
jgi:hypothetical protein